MYESVRSMRGMMTCSMALTRRFVLLIVSSRTTNDVCPRTTEGHTHEQTQHRERERKTHRHTHAHTHRHTIHRPLQSKQGEDQGEQRHKQKVCHEERNGKQGKGRRREQKGQPATRRVQQAAPRLCPTSLCTAEFPGHLGTDQSAQSL